MAADMTTRPVDEFAFGHEGPVNIAWDERASTYTSDDPRAKYASLFEIRATNGFMPTHQPAELPELFAPLDTLLKAMPAKLIVTDPRPGEPLRSDETGFLFVGEHVEPAKDSDAAAELDEIRRDERRLRKVVEGKRDAMSADAMAAALGDLRAVHDRKRAAYHALMPEVKARYDALYAGDGVDAALPLYGAVAALPNLVNEVRAVLANGDRRDSGLVMALYRDYSFLLSAYVFEPCHWFYQVNYRLPNILGPKNENTYGLARATVPAQIAQPLKLVADALGNLPFMEYQQAWGLNNWRFVHDTISNTAVPTFVFSDGSLNYAALIDAGMFEYDNLDIMRPSVGTEDERGFAVVHVQLEAHTGKLILAARAILDAADKLTNGSDEPQNVLLDRLRSGLHMHADTLKRICEIQNDMWKRSSPTAYMDLRTFIMGAEGNSGDGKIFPAAGLAYEFEDGVQFLKPRGESGANSSIIPAADTLFGVVFAYPRNQLTKYLSELRSYRPLLQRDYLRLLGDAVTRFNIVEYTRTTSSDGIDTSSVGGLLARDPVSKFLWLINVSLIRRFRLMHWNHTKAYIIQNSRAPVATGGTPIISWLPNNLGAVLQLMQAIIRSFSDDDIDAINVHFAPELHLLRTYFEGRPTLPADVLDQIDNADTAYDMLMCAFAGTVDFCREELQHDKEELRDLIDDEADAADDA